MTRSVWLVCALLASAAWAAPTEPVWAEFTTDHFHALTDADPAAAKAIVLQLESMRAAVTSTWSGLVTDPAVPLHVFLFRDDASFAPWAERVRGASVKQLGLFVRGYGVSFMLVNLGDAANGRRSAFHEYAHFLIDLNYPRLPLWLSEGLAEYFSTLEATGGHVKVGAAVTDHVRWLNLNDVLPLRVIAATTSDSPEYSEDERVGGYYAHAWAFVHLLMHDSPESREKLRRVLELCSQGRPFDEAFAVSYCASYEDFDRAFEAYVKRPEWKQALFDAGEAPRESAFQASAANVLEVRALLGWLKLSRGQAGAAALFDEVLARAPAHPTALAGRAFGLERERRLDEAASMLERALAADPRHYLANSLLAEVLMDDASWSALAPAERTARTTRIRTLLGRSLAAYPRFPEAMALLGASYALDPRDPARGIALLEQARAHAADPRYVLVNLAKLYSLASDEAGVDRVLRELCQRDPRDCVQQRQVAWDRLERVRGLIEGKQYDEACRQLRRIEPSITEEGLRAEIKGLLQNCDRNDCVARWNVVVDLANSGRTKEALDALDRAIPRCKGKDPELVRRMALFQQTLRRRLGSE